MNLSSETDVSDQEVKGTATAPSDSRRYPLTYLDVAQTLLPYAADKDGNIVPARFSNPTMSEHPKQPEMTNLVFSAVKLLELLALRRQGGLSAVSDYFYKLVKDEVLAEMAEEERKKLANLRRCAEVDMTSSSTSTSGLDQQDDQK